MLLLNVPPNSSGLIHPTDIRSLAGFKRLLDAVFSSPVTAGAYANATSAHGCPSQPPAGAPAECPYSPTQVLTEERGSFWAAGEGDEEAVLELRLEGDEGRRFDVVDVREAIALGQRVVSFEVQAFVGEAHPRWAVVSRGSTIGARQLKRLPVGMKARRVRLVIKRARGAVCISYFGLYFSGHSASMFNASDGKYS